MVGGVLLCYYYVIVLWLLCYCVVIFVLYTQNTQVSTQVRCGYAMPAACSVSQPGDSRYVKKFNTVWRATTLVAQPSSPTCDFVAQAEGLQPGFRACSPATTLPTGVQSALFAKHVRTKTWPLPENKKPSLSCFRLIAGLPFGAGN